MADEWIPASAGMTSEELDPGLRRNDEAANTIPTQPSPRRGGL